MEINRADVAELVDARDLKCFAPFEFVDLSCKTLALRPIKADGTERDLQNNSEPSVVRLASTISTLDVGFWRARRAVAFLLGALAIMALTLKLPLAALLAIVALVGIGTSGTQTLIYGFVANFFPTRVRGAGVAWCAGFGRLGGVGGPLIGGLLIASGLSIDTIFFVLAGLALLGVIFTLLVPASKTVVTQGLATVH
jgi:MFS family permease